MISTIYLALKEEDGFDPTIKCFYEKESAVRQLKAWLGQELIDLNLDYDHDNDEEIAEWANRMFKTLSITKDEYGEIASIYAPEIGTSFSIREQEID